MNLRCSAPVLAVVLTVLCTCGGSGSWTRQTMYEAVWADDGVGILVIRTDYEARETQGCGTESQHHETRNLRSELALTSRADLVNRRVIASGLPGPARFYFIKRAGYIAVDGPNDGFIDLDSGKFRALDLAILGFSNTPPVRLLPGPSGSTIAVLQPSTVASNTADRLAMIRSDGSVLTSPIEIPARESVMDLKWTTPDSLDVRLTGNTTLRVSKDGVITKSARPDDDPSESQRIDGKFNGDEVLLVDTAGRLTIERSTAAR